MSKLVFKQVTVKSSVDLSPSILRLTLQGDELKAFPTDCESGYISSYWKQGVTEDGHKVLKRQDAEEQIA